MVVIAKPTAIGLSDVCPFLEYNCAALWSVIYHTSFSHVKANGHFSLLPSSRCAPRHCPIGQYKPLLEFDNSEIISSEMNIFCKQVSLSVSKSEVLLHLK